MQSSQALTIITAPPTRVLTKNLTTGASYDKVSRLVSAEQAPFDTLRELHTLLKGLARQQHSCVIRGSLRSDAPTPLLRRKTHFADEAQSWVMLDIDDLAAPRKLRTYPYSDEHAAYAVSQLPAAFHNAGYVWQASASAGADKKRLKLHLWFLLDAPLTSAQLRHWLKGVAHIDPSTLRAVQPHYTANPIGGAKGKRLGRVKGPRVTTPEDITEVEDITVAAELEVRPKGSANVAQAQIDGAWKAAKGRAHALLQDPNIVGWQAAYQVGCYLGAALALRTWNDEKHGHTTWQPDANALAAKWGKRFAKLPDAKHSQEDYGSRVLEGIQWSVANERGRLATRSLKAEAEALERTEELQHRLLNRMAKHAGSLKVLNEVGSALGKYRDIIGRDALLAELRQHSGLSETQCAEAIDNVEQVNVSAWREGLLFNKEEIAATDENVMLIMQRYPGFKESFMYNVRAMKLELTAANVLGLDAGAVEPDALTMKLVLWLGSLGCRKVSMHAVRNAFAMYQEEIERYDPFLVAFPEASLSPAEAKAALKALKKPRLYRWLQKYMGAVGDDEYLSAAGARTLIAAVARAKQPGCEVHTMLVLMGEQGIGKTSAIKTLANVIPQGYRELLDTRDRDALLVMQSGLLVEMSEMRVLRTNQEESIKAFMTRSTDYLRAPYARASVEHQRRMVFIGTTNDDDFLSDRANRRYWPVSCVGRSTLTPAVAVKLWREAALRYAAGEQWWLTDDEAELQAAATAHVRAENVIETTLRKQLKGVDRVSLMDAIRLTHPDSREPARHQRQVAHALRAIGWQLKRTPKRNMWMRMDAR